ncbi:hypothetical protein HOLleu_02143 [Holothuria leucospilota]|uniref:LRRNT domain-containing protein n=1 Tax=Holothuria leucospilota TaxID=206669 RepID=A0A9Q1CRS3_HOLLE|nr:hypothetical protein HOLleu_02143 [Holothuria leucospilota]
MPMLLQFRCPFSITSPWLSKCLFLLLACTPVLGDAAGSETSACGDGGICHCFRTGTKGYEVNCSSRNLDTFPQNIPNNVTKL